MRITKGPTEANLVQIWFNGFREDKNVKIPTIDNIDGKISYSSWPDKLKTSEGNIIPINLKEIFSLLYKTTNSSFNFTICFSIFSDLSVKKYPELIYILKYFVKKMSFSANNRSWWSILYFLIRIKIWGILHFIPKMQK